MDEQTNQTAPTQGTSGKNTTVIVIIILAVIAILGIGGYFISRYFIKKATGNAADSIMNAATGQIANANTNNTTTKPEGDNGSMKPDQNSIWPTDMPSEVPQFKYGKITFSSKIGPDGNDGWTVTVEGVGNDALKKYKKDLEGKGWTAQAKSTDPESASILQYEKGDYQIMVSYDSNSKGVNLTVVNKL